MEIDLTLYFCPECKREEMWGHLVNPSAYCHHCGTEIMKAAMIVCVKDGEITRLLLKGKEENLN